MHAVKWPDGRIDSARTWLGLMDRINDLEWNSHLSPEEFRKELAARAFVWCGKPLVHPSSPPRQFFQELERAGMLRIIDLADPKKLCP